VCNSFYTLRVFLELDLPERLVNKKFEEKKELSECPSWLLVCQPKIIKGSIAAR
jgi:hypothetical protein